MGLKKLLHTSCNSLVIHLQLLQNRLMSKDLSFQRALNINTLSLYLSSAKGFFRLNLAPPHRSRLLKKDTKWKGYGYQK